MVRMATEASLKDWENGNNARRGNRDQSSSKGRNTNRSRTRSGENDSSTCNRQQDIRRTKSEGGDRLVPVREDENLIDFGTDNSDAIARGVSQITISKQTASDVSVLGDEDATTASFMAKTGWNSAAVAAPPMRQPSYPMGPIYNSSLPYSQPSLQPHFHDPTFNPQLRPWNAGSFTSDPSLSATPRTLSDASFAVPPPPTWDDYNNAFGGGAMSSSIAAGSVSGSTIMSPVNMSSLMGGALVPAPQDGGASQYSINMPQMQTPSQWQTQSFGAPPSVQGGVTMGASAAPVSNFGKNSKFDPLRNDPFAS